MQYNKKTVRDAAEDGLIAGKTVLLRSDLNVPLDKMGKVKDPRKIVASLDTVRYLREQGAMGIVMMSHLGRPDGKPVPSLSMKTVYDWLAAPRGGLGPSLENVVLAPDCIGPETVSMAKSATEGRVVLLENTRFYPEEEANDSVFSASLSTLGDVYVDDAWGTAHRAHASNVGVARLMPSYIGLLMKQELTYIGNLLGKPEQPFIIALGGAKAFDKIPILKNLERRISKALIGGALGNAFLASQGRRMGTSKVDQESLGPAGEVLGIMGDKILLPTDVIVCEKMETGLPISVRKVDDIPSDVGAYDIGPETQQAFGAAIEEGSTIFYNGPQGVTAIEEFTGGTRSVLAAGTNGRGRQKTTTAGGGDMADAVTQLGYAEKLSWVSTGGGATLEVLGGEPLLALEVIKDARRDPDEWSGDRI